MAAPLGAVAAAAPPAALITALVATAILLPLAFFAWRRLSVAAGRPGGAAPEAAPRGTPRTTRRRERLAAAALRYEAAGELQKAAALHLRSDNPLRAAGIYLRTGKHLKAAKILRREGNHLRAAQALEFHGDRAAAACGYAEAGSPARAARLFVDERLFAEAAAVYRPLLGDAGITVRNAGLHITYAALLALAGDRQPAADVYGRVLAALPGHLRAVSGLRSLLARASLPNGPPPDSEPIAVAVEDLELWHLEFEEVLRRALLDPPPSGPRSRATSGAHDAQVPGSRGTG